MRDSNVEFTPKFPTPRVPSIKRLLAKSDFTKLSDEALGVYKHSSYDAKVLFIPWALSTFSERLSLDLFAVCFVLRFTGEWKYSSTRSLLNAYWKAGWLKNHEVQGQRIRYRTDIEGQIRPPPTLKMKPKRRYDIAGLGFRNDIDGWEIQVPGKRNQWRDFLKSTRQLFSFPSSLDDCSRNLVPLAMSAIALQENPKLKSTVDHDIEMIREGLEELVDAYFFLPLGLNEKRWKASNRESAVHLAAFGLFSYATWPSAKDHNSGYPTQDDSRIVFEKTGSSQLEEEP